MIFFRSLRSSSTRSASIDEDDDDEDNVNVKGISAASSAPTTPHSIASTTSTNGCSSPASPATTMQAPTMPSNIDEMNIKAEDEPDEDPVRVSLEKEVRERDSSISTLEKIRAEKQQELQEMEQQLEVARLHQMKDAIVHKIECECIQRQTTHAVKRFQVLDLDMQDKAAIHGYANLIKGVAPKGSVDSQYVFNLQSQLQKAVQKLESIAQKMIDIEENSRTVVDQLSAEINQLVEERCRIELELRKQMEVLEEQIYYLRIDYEKRIHDKEKILQALRTKAANQVSIDDLEAELEASETKFEDLKSVFEKQAKTIEKLKKSLATENGE